MLCALAAALVDSPALAAPPSPDTVYSSPIGTFDWGCNDRSQMQQLVAAVKDGPEAVNATAYEAKCERTQSRMVRVGESIDYDVIPTNKGQRVHAWAFWVDVPQGGHLTRRLLFHWELMYQPPSDGQALGSPT